MSKQTTTDFDKRLEDMLIEWESGNPVISAFRVDARREAIKRAVSELVEECKPERADVPPIEPGVTGITSPAVEGAERMYNYAIDEYEKNLKEALGQKKYANDSKERESR